MSHVLADPSTARPIRTAAEAEAYIAAVCFKHGPPRRFGVELEWLLTDPSDPARQPDTTTLRAALKEHAPRTLNFDSPAAPLPAGGLVTVEPGGQVEISSAPHRSPAGLIAAMRRDEAALRALLEPTGFALAERASLHRPPVRILRTPRYDAMAAAFARIGPAGAQMMCASAATQICLDLGQAEQAHRRWRLAHRLGPVLLAAFANSPAPAGSPALASQRMAAWWALDPERTRPPKSLEPADYCTRALDTRVLARQGGQAWLLAEPVTLRQLLAGPEPVTTADIDLHLSMIFPPVRPQGYLELRYLDAQPAGEWPALLALVTALFAGPLEPVAEIVEPVGDRWPVATEAGLADPALRRAAAELAELVPAALNRIELAEPERESMSGLLGRRLAEGISPALEVTR